MPENNVIRDLSHLLIVELENLHVSLTCESRHARGVLTTQTGGPGRCFVSWKPVGE